MLIRAVSFHLQKDELVEKPLEFAVEHGCQSIQQAVPETGKTVFLVAEEELKAVQRFEDAGKKIIKQHSGKQIRNYISSRKKQLPLIITKYVSSTTLKNAVREALLQADLQSGSEQQNILCCIGTSRALFNKIWDDSVALTNSSPVSSSKSQAQQTTPDGFTKDLMARDQKASLVKKIFLGSSPQAEVIRQQIYRCAKHDQPILILGETGTGKGLVAQSIHQVSHRGKYPFVTINCGAIPETLFESTLFGIKERVATDVKENRGKILEADGGTLFLDEIGDLPLEQQVKILNFLQDKKVQPVGGLEKDTIRVNVRVIAATNRELDVMIRNGTFRADLYFRLRVIPLRTPPLREQGETIAELAQIFWKKIANDSQAQLSQDIIQELCKYGFPGNTRELKYLLTSLYYYFFDEDQKLVRPQLKHLREIFLLLGIRPHDPLTTSGPELSANSHEVLDSHRVKCLQVLKRSAEWMNSTKVLLDPYLLESIGKLTEDENLCEFLPVWLDDLGSLIENPLHFYSQDTFSSVNQVKGKLTYFKGLWAGGLRKEARNYLKEELIPIIDKASDSIFNAVKELTRNY